MPKRVDAGITLLAGQTDFLQQVAGAAPSVLQSMMSTFAGATLPEMSTMMTGVSNTATVVASLPIAQTIEIMTIFGEKIVGSVEFVIMNRRQMRTLGERIKSVVDATQRLSDMPSAQKKYATPLCRLIETLTLCAEWVVKYGNKGLLTRLIKGRSHNIKFEDFHQALIEHVHDLQLGLHVQEWMDLARHKRERDQDLQDLKTNQSAFLVQIKEATEEITDLGIQGSDRAEILSKKMAAVESRLKLFLEKQASVENVDALNNDTLLDEAILTDYCDLEMERKIGEGSFGKIFYGHLHGQEMVVKDINNMERPEVSAEFFRETKILSQLRSPYIVQLYAACVQPQRACYVMEYMAKGNLVAYLSAHSGLSAHHKHQLGSEISLGLAYLHHHQILHGDLRTANVLINETGHAKLADFGFSIAPEIKGLPALPASASSKAYAYLAPEVLLGSPYTKASEVYSFGMVLWQILTGKTPYQHLGKDIKAHVIAGGRERIPSTLPMHYVDLLKDCWNELPSTRPTMSKVVQVLKAHTPTAVNQGTLSIAAKAFPTGPREPTVCSQQLYNQGMDAALEQNDYAQAARMLEEASNEGHTRARTDLAFMYLDGLGVKKNPAFAQQLLQQSAVEGHPRAMSALASMLGGAEIKNKQAISFWQSQASRANKGNAVAARQAGLRQG